MEDVDRVLSAEEEIIPSSGFTRSVMEAVRREAAAPMPIPFPWRRALPGLSLLAVVVIAVVLVPPPMNREVETGLPTVQLADTLGAFFELMSRLRVDWLLASILLAWTSATVSMRLASLRS